jgi:hypothetical protein
VVGREATNHKHFAGLANYGGTIDRQVRTRAKIAWEEFAADSGKKARLVFSVDGQQRSDKSPVPKRIFNWRLSNGASNKI